MDKRKRTLKEGQRVRLKDQKGGDYGVVVSDGPATIGDKRTCKIPGGPLVLKDFVYVRWYIKGKPFICLENINDLDIVKK